ncbi:uncharacterized protein PV09_01603 [Verruconis gallopava]|uniref:DNA-directed RNA polymerases I and III subunit RPAC1 n=1 Tax=Verruconis gallopava TaxID=253628 RepID=A0A0D2ALL8_9PEZI|nr:uncharacterized protein PV09_01603 [Verruconis gallopava]KIW07663.1 hypothetical protein PV09_01603 [Verruconis gallopava]
MTELDRRKLVTFTADTIKNVSSDEYPQYYPGGEDYSWSVDKFKKNFRIQMHKAEPLNATFSLIGIDASIANAFRRILLAEIPTLAIETAFIMNNTSIVQDEVLAHRLGLIPLKGGKEGIQLMTRVKKREDGTAESVFSDYNTVVLNLKIECKWKPNGPQKARNGVTDVDELYENPNVYAKHLVFEPQGRQTEWFDGENAIRPVHPDILIAKLRPGQTIHAVLHCNKGIGADHAKFSPVATAFYRLLPQIDIVKPIFGKDALKFARCFPKGVIKRVPVTQEDLSQPGFEGAKEGDEKAVVDDPMKDTVSRECLRHDEFKNKVKLGRVRDHFIFSVESTGQFDSEELFIDSVKLLKTKCARVKRSLARLKGMN